MSTPLSLTSSGPFRYYVGYTNGRCIKKCRSLTAAQRFLATYVNAVDLIVFDMADFSHFNPS